MKPGIIFFVFTFFVSFSTGCVDSKKDEGDGYYDVHIELSDIEIPWKAVFEHLPARSLAIIRSDEDVQNYMPGESISEIDFEEQSLLLLYGFASNGIYDMKRTFVDASGSYSLDVNLYLDSSFQTPKWAVAMLVPAIPRGANVDFKISMNY